MNGVKMVGMALVTVGLLAQAAENKPVTRYESLELTATVESIDPKSRVLVLKGDRSGERAVFVAGPDVRNLEQVKTGDKVSLTYRVGVAARLKPKGTPVSAPTESAVEERAGPGTRPGGRLGWDVAATVQILAVDPSFNTVTFKRADGITRVIAVEDPDAQRFARSLKPGDSVEISYSEAVAVRVDPAAPK